MSVASAIIFRSDLHLQMLVNGFFNSSEIRLSDDRCLTRCLNLNWDGKIYFKDEFSKRRICFVDIDS